MILFDVKTLMSADDARAPEEPFLPKAAVAAVFDQVRHLRKELDRIATVMDPILELSAIANVFGPMRRFERQISELVAVLEPMHKFKYQLRQTLKQFKSLEPLDEDLNELCAT